MAPTLVRRPDEMRELAEDRRRDGKRIAVVPTMGYLHAGHASLLRYARGHADIVILTLFVNPTQFAPGEDLERYPRDEERDLALAEECHVDFVFAPATSDIYSREHDTTVRVAGLSEPLCGASRPGHFDGVATIVTKLFHITLPHMAVFGEKDFQQLAIIRRLAADLDFGVEIASVPIVRESDGLALSSRNSYLSPEERQQSIVLFQGLKAAQGRFAEGVTERAPLLAAARAVIRAAPLADIEYLDLRDATTLKRVENVDRPAVLAAAVHFGRTRLIDNSVLAPE